MFASKKSSLIKQLWRKKIFNQPDEAQCEVETSTEGEWKNHLHRILKRLKEKQLEQLLVAVESKGGEQTNCVYVPRDQQDRKNAAATLCCRIWRWPDLDSVPLKRLSSCVNQCEDTECINPYHWSRLLVIGKHGQDWGITHLLLNFSFVYHFDYDMLSIVFLM